MSETYTTELANNVLYILKRHTKGLGTGQVFKKKKKVQSNEKPHLS